MRAGIGPTQLLSFPPDTQTVKIAEAADLLHQLAAINEATFDEFVGYLRELVEAERHLADTNTALAVALIRLRQRLTA